MPHGRNTRLKGVWTTFATAPFNPISPPPASPPIVGLLRLEGTLPKLDLDAAFDSKDVS